MMVEKLLFQQEKGLNWGSLLPNKVLFTEAICLPGFEPQSLENWKKKVFSSGCRRSSDACGKKDTFLSLKTMKFGQPDSSLVIEDEKQCREECLRNCQCQAHSFVKGEVNMRRDEQPTNNTCLIWDDLKDLQEEYSHDGPDLFVRVAIADIESKAKSCEPCGINVIPYPLSNGSDCGDPMYSSFYCDNSTGKLSFKTHNGTYNVTTINQDTRTFVIQEKDVDDCNASTRGQIRKFNTSFPFKVNSSKRWCDSNVSSQGLVEIVIGWEPPQEPVCSSSSDCDDWPNSTCNKKGNGTARCLCNSNFWWDGNALNCVHVFDGQAGGYSRKKKPLSLIVGVAIATVIVLSSIFLYICILMRKKAKRRESQQNTERNAAVLYGTEKRVKNLMDAEEFNEEDKKGIDTLHFEIPTLSFKGSMENPKPFKKGTDTGFAYNPIFGRSKDISLISICPSQRLSMVKEEQEDISPPVWSRAQITELYPSFPQTRQNLIELAISSDLTLTLCIMKLAVQATVDLSDTFMVMVDGMKMSGDLKLISWKSEVDPKDGNFTFKLDEERGQPVPNSNSSSTTRSPSDYNNKRIRLDVKGELQYWNFGSLQWMWPRDKCSVFNACGNFGSCNLYNRLPCRCLPGFKPSSQENWRNGDFSGGCIRSAVACGKNGIFLNLKNMRVGQTDTSFVVEDEKKCREECLDKCQCQAYSFVEVKVNKRRDRQPVNYTCLIWMDDLKDIQEEYSYDEPDLFVRVLIADIESKAKSCEPCGINVIPYPLSNGSDCGDPMYSSFYCDKSTGKLSFKTHNGTYNVTTINQDTRTFVIQEKDVDDCLVEIVIGWEPPQEPVCSSSSDCDDWSNSTCNKKGNGTARCLCNSNFWWDGNALNCVHVFDGQAGGSSRKKKPLSLIVGVAIATVIVLSSIFLYICIFMRKKAKRRVLRVPWRIQNHLKKAQILALPTIQSSEGPRISASYQFDQADGYQWSRKSRKTFLHRFGVKPRLLAMSDPDMIKEMLCSFLDRGLITEFYPSFSQTRQNLQPNNRTSHIGSDLALTLCIMKLAVQSTVNVTINKNFMLTSWKSPSDPASGDFKFQLDERENQYIIMKNGSIPHWKSGVSGSFVRSDERLWLVSNLLMNSSRKPSRPHGNTTTTEESPYNRINSIAMNYTNTRLVMNFNGQIQFFLWRKAN
ncbi:hypothetical protein D5086_033872 [Populus alba]|uniref:Uncharacterized protein n=1 Tax=Populus alba TaxID=43335 RepID=A0ACC4AI41_POPAL